MVKGIQSEVIMNKQQEAALDAEYCTNEVTGNCSCAKCLEREIKDRDVTAINFAHQVLGIGDSIGKQIAFLRFLDDYAARQEQPAAEVDACENEDCGHPMKWHNANGCVSLPCVCLQFKLARLDAVPKPAAVERVDLPDRIEAGLSVQNAEAKLWARDKLNFKDFSILNRERCESEKGFNHKMNSWSLSDWFTATMGELGEAANVAKKLNRVRDGIPGNGDATPADLRQQLADEIADTFIYLDLLAQSESIDLHDAVIAKFDKTSKKVGYEKRLAFGELQ